MIDTVTRSRQVPVRDIAPALAELWQECVDADRDTSLGRTLTMNLIGVARGASEPRIVEARTRLLTRHPCRAFLVLLDDGYGEIAAEVGAETHVWRSCQQMVLEQVTLRCHPREIRKLPGLIRPLVVNDLPVHQYWGMELPADLDDLWLLGRMAWQTTVDSGLFADPAADLARLRSRAQGHRVVDLTWFRLRPWRRGLAEAFEHFEWLPEAPTSARIHGSTRGAAACHLLAYWLQQRLGATARIDHAGDAEPGFEPEAVEIHHGSVHVAVKRCGDEPRLRVQVTLADRCKLPFEVIASRGEPGDLLAAAVDAR